MINIEAKWLLAMLPLLAATAVLLILRLLIKRGIISERSLIISGPPAAMIWLLLVAADFWAVAIVYQTYSRPIPQFADLRPVSGKVEQIQPMGRGTFRFRLQGTEETFTNLVTYLPPIETVRQIGSRGETVQIWGEREGHSPTLIWQMAVRGQVILSYEESVKWEERNKVIALPLAFVMLGIGCFLGWYARKEWRGELTPEKLGR